MREFRTYGSVRGVRSNAHPYRDRNYSADFLVVRPQNFPRTAQQRRRGRYCFAPPNCHNGMVLSCCVSAGSRSSGQAVRTKNFSMEEQLSAENSKTAGCYSLFPAADPGKSEGLRGRFVPLAVISLYLTA